MTKKGTKKKAKQLRLKGTERIDGNKELDAAAADYVETRDARMELTEEEQGKKATVMSLIKQLGLASYVFEDDDGEKYEVKYTKETDENVTVRKVKPPKKSAED